ncbi:MAG: hypothetical protein ABJB12_07835 [Pseudomonadota bacterium]
MLSKTCSGAETYTQIFGSTFGSDWVRRRDFEKGGVELGGTCIMVITQLSICRLLSSGAVVPFARTNW